MIIIGIDPGTATTGYGIIKIPEKGKIETIAYGCITTDPDSCPGDRLKVIHNELNKLLKEHKPNVLAVENLFFFKNLKTVMPVSQAKGVVLMTAAKKKIPVFEFSPPQVKLIITGYGRADKKDVQKTVQKMLEIEEFVKEKGQRWHIDDAVDALGIALCYVKTELS